MARDMDFLYASARVKALETKLLGKADFDKMLDAEGAEEVLKLLADTDYGMDIAEMKNIYDFPKILYSHNKRAYDVIRDSVKNPLVVRFFTLKNDYHNLKVLIKNEILGPDEARNHYLYLGEVELAQLEKLAADDPTALVPDNIKEAYRAAKAVYEITQDAQQIDITLDNALFSDLKNITEKLGEDLIKEYFSAMADLTNIKTMIRLMKIKAEVRDLERALLPGGIIEYDFFVRLFNEPIQNIIDTFTFSPYQKVVDEGLSRFVNTKRLDHFEKLTDDYLINIARRGLYKPFGIEPVFGYLAATENEVNILRMVLVGKINGIPSDMLKEMLRDVYV